MAHKGEAHCGSEEHQRGRDVVGAQVGGRKKVGAEQVLADEQVKAVLGAGGIVKKKNIKI